MLFIAFSLVGALVSMAGIIVLNQTGSAMGYFLQFFGVAMIVGFALCEWLGPKESHKQKMWNILKNKWTN